MTNLKSPRTLFVGAICLGVTSSVCLAGSSGAAEAAAPGWAEPWQSVTRLVSKVGRPVVQANRASYSPVVAGDCTTVAFQSAASNLVPGDTKRYFDAFARKRGQHQVVMVSRALGGAVANGDSIANAVSGGGRYVAYESYASNLVRGDTNSASDVFVRDLTRNRSQLVSVAYVGRFADGDSHRPSLSAGARYVAFDSTASNLVPNDTNGSSDVFVRDRVSGTTERISLAEGGVQANGDSFGASISANGRYVAYVSTASNVTIDDGNGVSDVFRYDRQTGISEIVSIALGGDPAEFGGGYSDISANGRYVAFASSSRDLVVADGPAFDVFVRDMNAFATSLVSVAADGGSSDGDSFDPSVSRDGTKIAFSSLASNLVAQDDANGAMQDFIRDTSTATTSRLSVSSGLVQANDWAYKPDLSSNGVCGVFASSATNLVHHDTNGVDDIFVRRMAH